MNNAIIMVDNHQEDGEHYRRLASSLVENLLTKAIAKASQKLSSNSDSNDHEVINHNDHNEDHHHHHNHSSIQLKRNVANPLRLNDTQSTATCSTSIAATRTSSSTPPISSSSTCTVVPNYNYNNPMVDLNGNAPEIQIDLVGPRTPSPEEESSFELPPMEKKQYKFKVKCNEENESPDENSDDFDHEFQVKDINQTSKKEPEPELDDNYCYHNNNNNNRNNNNNSYKVHDNNKVIVGDGKRNGESIKETLTENNYGGPANNQEETTTSTMKKSTLKHNNKAEKGEAQPPLSLPILKQKNEEINHNKKKESKSIQIVEMMTFNRPSQNNQQQNQEVDVATTPELDIDLEQAHEMSKHIVADIINQAVHRLNEDIKNTKQQIKHEPESISKISCYSSRSMIQNNCSWLTRTRHALRRIMRQACICTKVKQENNNNSNKFSQHSFRNQHDDGRNNNNDNNNGNNRQTTNSPKT